MKYLDSKNVDWLQESPKPLTKEWADDFRSLTDGPVVEHAYWAGVSGGLEAAKLLFRRGSIGFEHSPSGEFIISLESSHVKTLANNAYTTHAFLREVTRRSEAEDKVSDLKTEKELRDAVDIQRNEEFDRMNFKVVTDEKTGLITEKTFQLLVTDRQKKQEEEQAKRGDHAPEIQNAVLTIDVDGLSEMNSKYLHAGADKKAIIPVARIAAKYAEKFGGFACRWGKRSDEYSLFIPDVSANEALAIAEEFKADVNKLKLQKPVAGKKHVGVTIGIADLWAKGGVEEAIIRADTACLVAKEADRRNTVSHYSLLKQEDSIVKEKYAEARQLLAGAKKEDEEVRQRTPAQILQEQAQQRKILDAIRAAEARLAKTGRAS